MKKYIIIIFCCLHSLISFSQLINIKGIVKDATTMEGIEFTTVTLMKSDSTFVSGSLTDSLGCFELSNPTKIDDAFLRISYIGYKTKFIPLSSFTDELILMENNNTLNEVAVTGKRPFFQQEIDKYVINVSDNLVSAGRNALDVLRNTPGVIIQNKNITLIGGGVDIWIDGRPSRMSGEQLASFLEGMQAENIDKIEVITNPSSKYDAGGTSGIINIKLKKNMIDTFNGTVNTGYELSKRHKGMGGISLNYKKKKVNLYMNYNLRGGKDVSLLDEITTYTDQNNNIQSYDKHFDVDVDQNVSHNYRLGMDIFADKSNVFGVLFNGFNNDSKMSVSSQTTIIPALNTSQSTMDGKYNTKNNGQMYNLNYKHTFGREDQEISTDLDYAHFSNSQNQDQIYMFYTDDNLYSEPKSSERNFLPQKNNIWSIRIDYKQSCFKNAFFEAGAKYGQTKTDNDILYEALINDIWSNDTSRSNYFKYNEDIFAAYFNFRHQLGKWSYQVGLRTEYTGQKGNQVTINQINENNYWDLFPTLYLQYKLSDKHSFVMSYNRRFDRPDYSLLNPFEIVLDKYSFIKGNPNLKPAYGNNINLKYVYSGKFSATFNITDLKDAVFGEPIIQESDGRYGSSYGNFGRRTAYIIQLGYYNLFFNRWRMNTMGQLAYIKQNAGNTVENFDNNGFMGFLMINNNIKLSNLFSAEINYMMIPNMRMGYNKSEKLNNNLSFGMRYSILKEKGSISLNVNDIYNGTLVKNSAVLNNIRKNTFTNNNLRTLTLSFTYKFGSTKLKDVRERSIGIDEEVNRSIAK